MSESPNLIVANPQDFQDDQDPSGGWGLVFLIVVFVAVLAVSVWIRFVI